MIHHQPAVTSTTDRSHFSVIKNTDQSKYKTTKTHRSTIRTTWREYSTSYRHPTNTQIRRQIQSLNTPNTTSIPTHTRKRSRTSTIITPRSIQQLTRSIYTVKQYSPSCTYQPKQIDKHTTPYTHTDAIMFQRFLMTPAKITADYWWYNGYTPTYRWPIHITGYYWSRKYVMNRMQRYHNTTYARDTASISTDTRHTTVTKHTLQTTIQPIPTTAKTMYA